MLKAFYKKYQVKFKFNTLTSRGGMEVKNGYYLQISDGQYTGVGECSFIEGLSIDDLQDYEQTLQLLCKYLESGNIEPLPDLGHYPSIKFGWETALLDLHARGSKILFESDFTRGKSQIPINGLIWMGSRDFMLQQIAQKLAAGFKCIKIKIGAINFEDEIMLLDFIRQKYAAGVMEIRLDANGAFKSEDVFKKLDSLSKFNIHSVEQPVKQGQLELMKKVCAKSPIPVALDEELIDLKGIGKRELLQFIDPQYIILKPSLLGGFAICNEWIELAEEQKTGWWATSALESNIGLNAIAQWVFTKSENMVQGLGTGGLYTNNISSPLFINKGYLGYNPALPWENV
jgi:O-succinylbenzoate synthase